MKRRSGFLTPSFSDTKNLGSSVKIPYFWSLNDDKNFTITTKIFGSENPLFQGEYHQAYAKGVKILGATAHYVSSDLDEGPIIEQSVERVDHSKSPKDLELIGRDLESITLAKAVKYHIERRIFINNSKTVIFN